MRVTTPETAAAESAALTANASSRSIVRNSAASFLSFGVNAIAGFIVTPFLLRGLGASGFGLWALVLSIVGYVSLVELGIGAATWREVAAAEANAARHTLDEVLGSSRLLYLAVSLIGVVVMVPVVAALPHLVNLPSHSVGQARVALSILAIAQALRFYFNVYSAALIGRGRFDLLALPGLVTSVATAAAQVGVVALTASVSALAAVMLAAAVATSAINRYVYVKAIGGTAPKLRTATRRCMRTLLRLGRYNAALSLFGTIAYNSDLVVIAIFLPTTSVAAYAVASRAVGLIRILATRVSDILLPTFADSSTRGDRAREFRLFSESVLVGLTLALAGCAALILFGPGLLALWLGTPPAESTRITALLAGALMLQMPAISVFAYFSGTGALRAIAWYGAFQAALNLGLSLALVATIGITGPALATMFEVAVAGIVLPLLACRAMGARYRDYARASLAPLAPAVVLVLSLGWAVRTWAEPGPGLSGVCAVLLALLSVAAVITSMGGNRRARYARVLQRSAWAG
jgi:O-antigen/teichoic acid export membrane protein